MYIPMNFVHSDGVMMKMNPIMGLLIKVIILMKFQ